MRSTLPVDVDGDTDLDIVALYPGPRARGAVGWYANEDGEGGFSEFRQILTNAHPQYQTLNAGDLDGDGDADLVLGLIDASEAGKINGSLVWLENIDGKGTFSEEIVIDEGLNVAAETIAIGDIDGDGDLDLAGGFSHEHFGSYIVESKLTWYENVNGNGQFVTHQIGESQHIGKVVLADVDNDDDLDILSNIAWYENVDGEGDYEFRVLHLNEHDYNDFDVADIDGDGDMDVVASYSRNNVHQVVWHENSQDIRDRFDGPSIIQDNLTDVQRVVTGDLNRDGEIDVLSFTLVSLNENYVNLHENTGNSTFETTLNLVSPDRPFSAHLVDLDRDSDLDLLIGSQTRQSSVTWYENKFILAPGDANRDGVFDSSDLVKIFQAGEYEDSIRGNSTIDEGDFDGDLDFTTADLVFVFQHGTYSNAAARDNDRSNERGEFSFEPIVFHLEPDWKKRFLT